MANIFDDISRILATPMRRSTALRLILGALAGAVLTPLGFSQSSREPCAGARGGSCPPGQKCCFGTHCCPHPHICCGDTCCPPPKECVNGICQEVSPTRSLP
jgi:hypothetical protein